jgi:hypothetical protein
MHSNSMAPSRSAVRRTLAGVLAAGALVLGAAPCAGAPALSLTTTAKLLAGVAPGGDDPAVARITAGAAWRQHSRAAQAGDQRLRQRLAHIQSWQADHLAQVNHGATLLYPFSGPDFINAYALFPDAERYVFFSLEAIGKVPRLDEMDADQQAELFDDLRAALNDLVALNFFITPNMKEGLDTDALHGTVPVLLAMMGMLDLQVDEVSAFDPWPERNRGYAERKGAGPRPALPAAGVRIVFTNPRTARRQTLEYLSLDVSDRELRYYPEFLPSLRAYEHPTVLLKSASYLLHGSHFNQLRGELLADAAAIVQDDTGVPYQALRKAGYAVTLFGQYEHPVKLFEGRDQPDLEQAFAKESDARPLPFPFGYNWRKEGKSGLILARRPSAAAAAARPAGAPAPGAH